MRMRMSAVPRNRARWRTSVNAGRAIDESDAMRGDSFPVLALPRLGVGYVSR